MPSKSTDRYFGFEDTALLCEHIITALFPSSPSGTVGAGRGGLDTPPQSPTPGKEAPPQLGEFIAYALYRTRLPIAITHQALLLLARLKTRYPSARGTSTSPHRLFLSSLMLSSKISMDDTYSNQSWTLVGQNLFSLREVNQMERELFAFLGWNVVVRDEELAAWVAENVAPYEAERAAAVAAPRKSMEDRKRRRDSSQTRPPTPSPSTSRSPSPDSLRHRRASDAALAILQDPSLGALAQGPSSAQRSSRRGRSHTPDYRSSPYSANSSRPSSVSSSATSSPQSSMTTPGSTGPNTPHDSNSPVHGNCAFAFPAPSKKPTDFTVVDGDLSAAPTSVEVASW